MNRIKASMQILEKIQNKKKYIYLSHYDKDTQRVKNDYCGPANDTTMIKAYSMQLKILVGQKKDAERQKVEINEEIKQIQKRIARLKSRNS